MTTYEVRYSVYNDTDHTSYDASLWNCSQVVQANSSNQAQAIIESQFGGRAVVTAVMVI